MLFHQSTNLIVAKAKLCRCPFLILPITSERLLQPLGFLFIEGFVHITRDRRLLLVPNGEVSLLSSVAVGYFMRLIGRKFCVVSVKRIDD